MIKTTLDSKQMGMLSTGYIKNLFPKPSKGELLCSPVRIINNKEVCNFYFINNYYEELIDHIDSEILNGKMARSNAEPEWMNLIEALKTPTKTDRTEEAVIKEYWLSK